MRAIQWLHHHLAPHHHAPPSHPAPPSPGDIAYKTATDLSDQAMEAVRSIRFPDPFSPIVWDVEARRAVSQHDLHEVADIYARLPAEKKIIKPSRSMSRWQIVLHRFLTGENPEP